MDGPAVAAVVAVGVNLDYERHSLHPLLRGEVCAEAVHRDEDLRSRRTTDVGPEASLLPTERTVLLLNCFFWSFEQINTPNHLVEEHIQGV